VGFVWQQTSRNLFPYLSALENVALPMMLTSLGAAERDERARTLLDLVGLADRAGHTPETLSGGEQQRVAIGVALANHPALLLADEPTGELDDATAAEVFAVFDVVSKELKTTVVIVSHDQEIAQKVPRVVIIQDGKLSTEVRRAASFRRPGDGELREFTFVDPTGRLQIPREFLEQLNISERAKVFLEGDQLRIVRVDFDE
jgi:ABC-type lipoprotein export system ATPase subunit